MARKTLAQIAELCGVSRATVSAVLNGKPWVSEATRERVQKALREHRYQRHLVEHNLTRHFSRHIGVVVGDIRNPFNSELIHSLQTALSAKGYFTVQHTTDESYEGEVAAIRALRRSNLGGYVVAPVQEGRPHDHLQAIITSGRPLVCIGRVPELQSHVVDFDDQQGAKAATDYLIQAGHSDIACLAGPETSSFAKHRIMGFFESMMEHGRSVPQERIIRAGATFAGGHRTAFQVLAAEATRPTALLCFNDYVAMGAYRAAYDLGLRIPEDLSVVGFDDSQLAAVMGPPLTTVATWPEELGRETAEIVAYACEANGQSGVLHRSTRPKLIERDSVRRARPAESA